MYVENSYLSKQLCFLFYVSSKEIIKKYTNYLKEYELTYTGYIVLMAIENDEKLNIKKLGERVFLDSGTLTPLLKKLEKKDYVVRSREEKDERNHNRKPKPKTQMDSRKTSDREKLPRTPQFGG